MKSASNPLDAAPAASVQSVAARAPDFQAVWILAFRLEA